MLENVVYILLAIFAIPMFFGSIFFVGYIIEEQDHRHKIELEKAKQGIFDSPEVNEPFYKKYCKQILFSLIIAIIVIGICYLFKVPSELPKYILDIIK